MTHTRIPQFTLYEYVPQVIHSLNQHSNRQHAQLNARQVTALKGEQPWKTLDCDPLVHVVRQNDGVISSFLMRLGDGLMLTEYEVRLIESRIVTRAEAAAKCPGGIPLYYSNAYVNRYNARCLDATDNLLCHPACDTMTGYKNDTQGCPDHDEHEHERKRHG